MQPQQNGKKTGATPRTDVLTKIADFFGVPIDYLLGTVDLNEDGITFSDGSGYGGGSGSGAGFGDGSGYGGPLPGEKDKKRMIRKEDIMFALARGHEDVITDEMFDEIQNFANYLIQREAAKKEK